MTREPSLARAEHAQRVFFSAGTFVLAIVVDRVTDELQRAAMFISACGKANYSFHVVEMQRFQAGDIDILTPHVHRMVVAATDEPRKARLSKEQFFQELRHRAPQHASIAEELEAIS